jgi:hypothetical protein
MIRASNRIIATSEHRANESRKSKDPLDVALGFWISHRPLVRSESTRLWLAQALIEAEFVAEFVLHRSILVF